MDIFVDIVIENGFILDVFGLVELVGFDFSYVRCLVFKFEKIIVLLDVWFRKFDGIIGKLLIVLGIFGRLDCKIDIILSIGRFILLFLISLFNGNVYWNYSKILDILNKKWKWLSSMCFLNWLWYEKLFKI